jgi:hypothetical protein
MNEDLRPTPFGGPANSESPVALRRSLTGGLPFRLAVKATSFAVAEDSEITHPGSVTPIATTRV